MANDNGTPARSSRLLSFTEISTALSCFAQWDFKYGGRLAGTALKSKRIAPQLSGGRAWGAAVATWHQQSGTLLAQFDAMDALKRSLDADEKQMVEAGVLMPGFTDQRVELEQHLAQVFGHYIAHTTPLANLSRLEDEIVTPLPSRGGKRRSTVYRFQCFLDGFEDAPNGEWLIEYKLRGKLTKRWLVELGRQYRWYAWARQQETGKPIIGIKVIERLNDYPHPPKIVQGGKESALDYECPRCNASQGQPCEGQRGQMKVTHRERSALTRMLHRPSHDADQITSPELYVAACEEYGIDPLPETVTALGNRAWQQVVSIPFRPTELEEAGQELVSAAKLIRDLDRGDLYPIRNAKGGNCNSCDFKTICPNPMDELYVEQSFNRTVPKRLRGAPAPEPEPSTQHDLEEVPF